MACRLGSRPLVPVSSREGARPPPDSFLSVVQWFLVVVRLYLLCISIVVVGKYECRISILHRVCVMALGLAWLPIVIVGLTAIMMTMSYTISVLDGDVAKVFPYISDTGGKAPESCLFSQLLNIVGLLVLVATFIRYKQLESLDGNIPELVYRINRIGLFLGTLVALGMSLVANFQNTSDINSIHFLGASLMFLPGATYAALHTCISFQLFPEHNGKTVCLIRLAVTLVSIVAVLLTSICGVVASKQWDPPDDHQPHNKFHWKPEDGGYTAHIISAISEWFLGLGFVCYYMTFFKAFRNIELKTSMRLYVEPFPIINDDISSEPTRLFA